MIVQVELIFITKNKEKIEEVLHGNGIYLSGVGGVYILHNYQIYGHYFTGTSQYPTVAVLQNEAYHSSSFS